MSLAEMKKEAIDKIGNLENEKILQEVLKVLKTADEKEPLSLSQHYDAIKEQYSDVLQKLAQ